MNRKSFVLHLDALVILNKMPDEIAGKFIKIIYQYNIDGTLPEMDFALDMAVTPFVNQFIRDREKYENVSEKRRESGSKGGKQKVANGSKRKQKVANVADSDSDSDSVSDNDSNSDSKKDSVNKKNFIAPTFLEVLDYFKQNGYSELSARKAFDYYETGQWKDSKGNKVKNWKQKMNGVWFKDENKVYVPEIKNDNTKPDPTRYFKMSEYEEALKRWEESQ